jgi:hypothetical protein
LRRGAIQISAGKESGVILNSFSSLLHPLSNPTMALGRMFE